MKFPINFHDYIYVDPTICLPELIGILNWLDTQNMNFYINKISVSFIRNIN